jgi:hypothetical protein
MDFRARARKSCAMRLALAVLVLLASLAFAAAPLVQQGFGGFSPGHFPQGEVDPPVQPAGWAFGIWIVIYLWLIASAVWGLRNRGDDPVWDEVRLPLFVSLLVGVPWLFVAERSPEWATVMILVMAASAILALLRAPVWDNWWLRAPVGLYAGWLSAAAFVALGVNLSGYGLGLSGEEWAVVCIAAALVVALAVAGEEPGAPVYAAAVAWALLGIVAANYASAPWVAGLAGVGILLLLLVTLAGWDELRTWS